MNIIKRITRTTANGIHRGERTHHHDHVIVPISLSVMKTIVNRPPKPIEPLVELPELLIIFLLYYGFIDGKTLQKRQPSTILSNDLSLKVRTDFEYHTSFKKFSADTTSTKV